ncbi:MAG: carbamoyl phosphate synthase small subunit [Bacteroides sp.]|nr:carbamoyl phosphate synthase small subunit [Eubacterium sp.]MCM1417188.1 carbamoyl phosphate synthase small subunit [Roseburia sp.]MCM1461191.1 carbamoyl phosphate synthase small subunit [Bacteroides sp.]
MDFANYKKAFLILADGTVFEGKSFGASGTVIGEIVFTTAMTGYEETLTDPSYCGQLVTQTFPLIGNYGTNESDRESNGSVVAGYIVREHCEMPSNFRSEGTIDAFLKKYGIIGLYDIDTRRLTRIIREIGVMNGMITDQADLPKDKALEEIRAFRIGRVVPKVSVSKPERYPVENARFKVAMIDYGYKHNIRKELVKRGCDVTVFPYNVTAEEILAFEPDGIMLSNGPGDPELNPESIETLKKLIPAKIPTFGICLGHQLLALANGAKTVKLKYGHRGENQPVTDLDLGRTFITSQNHGYAVVGDSIPPEAGKMSHVNGNDRTCEGVRYRNAPAFTVQFHPEACGGPQDTAYLFDEFIELMEGK